MKKLKHLLSRLFNYTFKVQILITYLMNSLLSILFLLVFSVGYPKQNAYISCKFANLRSGASNSYKIKDRLEQHTNLIVTDTVEYYYRVVNEKKVECYVHQNLIRKGRAVVKTVSGGRTGARCRDGSYSRATGRGACSYHGGVANWIYAKRKVEEIEEN